MLIYSKKTSKHYLVCGKGRDFCGFISDAVKTPQGWKIDANERATELPCLACGKPLSERKTKAGGLILACSAGREKCDTVIFAGEKDVLGTCADCGKGYVYKDKTPTGKRLKKCSNKGCGFVEWEEDRRGSGNDSGNSKSTMYKGGAGKGREDAEREEI